MAIATFSGNSLAAASRNAAISLRVQFKDPSGVPVDVDSPVASLLGGGIAKVLVALGSSPDVALRYSLLPVGPAGLYKLTFLTTNLSAGLYRIVFEGDWTGDDSIVRTLKVEGDLALGEISRLDDWIRRVETALMDDDPESYRLDEPVLQWTADQIYVHVLAALDRINTFPPRLTDFSIDTLPFDQMAIDGARVYALYARARFEKANEMDYSDGHTLNIKRADFYKSLADTLYQQWEAEIVSYKRMTPPTPIGLKSQQLPFRISRILGLLPNFRTLFSG